MSEWIIKTVSIVILTAVISLILPEGGIGKQIKGVFSLITLFVLIQPVFDFFSTGEFSFEDYVNTEIVYQENYLNFITEDKKSVYEKNCLEILKNNGIGEATVVIEFEENDFYKIFAKKIQIKISNKVILDENEHKNSIDKTIKEISEYLKIEEKDIVIYE